MLWVFICTVHMLLSFHVSGCGFESRCCHFIILAHYFDSLFLFVIFIIEMYSKSNKTSNMYLFLRKQLTAFTYFTLYFKLLILNKCLIVSLSPQVKWSMIISNKLVYTNCQTSYRKTWVWVVGNYKYQENLKTS